MSKDSHDLVDDLPSTTVENPVLAAPSSVSERSLLMQDAIPAGALVHGDGLNQIALFSNPTHAGRREALVINTDRSLTYLQRTDATTTGWSQTLVADVPKVKEVVIIVQGRATEIFAACVTDDDNLFLLQFKAGAWQPSPNPPGSATGKWGRLCTFYVSDRPIQAYVFGIDPVGNELRCFFGRSITDTSDRWNSCHASKPLPRFTDFIAGFSHKQMGAGALSVYALLDGTVTRYGLDFGSFGEMVVVDVSTIAIQSKVEALISAWDTPSTGVGCLVMSSAAQEANLFACAPQYEQGIAVFKVPGLVSVRAAAWQDSRARLHIYSIDQKGTLQILNQTGWTATGLGGQMPIWAQALAPDGKITPIIVPVRPKVAAIVYDTFPDERPSQLLRIEGAAVGEANLLVTQELSTGEMHEEHVRLPSTGVLHLVTRYVSEMTLLDGYGRALPDQDITISAASTIEIQVGGVSYLVGPQKSVTLKTDRVGTLTLSVPGTGLTPPAVYVNAVGMAAGAAIRPGAGVHRYLAGTDTLPSQAGRLDGSALAVAHVGGKPLVPKWTNFTPDEIAVACTDTFAIAGGKTPPLRAVAGHEGPRRIAGFAFQTFDTTRPAYGAFVTPQTLGSAMDLLRADPRYGGRWEDFTDWADEVWAGIKAGVVRVAQIVVDGVSRMAQIVIYIGDKLVELGRFVLGAVEDAARVVEALFQAIDAGVSRLVDWLKALFNLSDIWDTKTALESGLRQLPREAKKVVVMFQGLSHGTFESLEQRVTEAFAGLRSTFAHRTISSVEAVAAKGIPAGSAGGSAVSLADMKNNPQSNWLMSRVGSHAAALPALESRMAHESLWEALQEAWKQSPAAGNFASAGKDFFQLFSTVLDPNNPQSLAEQKLEVLVDFLEHLIKATLQTCDAVVHQMLAMVIATLDEIESVLFAPIDLGPLQPVYDWIQRSARPQAPVERPSMGSLVCLLMAFPVTVGYKLAMGVNAAPFPGGKLLSKPPLVSSRGVVGEAFQSGVWNIWILVPTFAQITYTGFEIASDTGKMSEAWFARLAAGYEAVMLLVNLPFFDVDSSGALSIHVDPTNPTQTAQMLSWIPPLALAISDNSLAWTSNTLLRNYSNGGAFKPGLLFSTLLGASSYATMAWEWHAVPSTPLKYKIGCGLIAMSPTTQILRWAIDKPGWGKFIGLAKAGPVNIVADFVGALFRLEGMRKDEYSLVVDGGNNQSAPVGKPFTSPMRVTLSPKKPGVRVMFIAPPQETPTAATGGFANGASFSTTVTTDKDGQATASPFVANAYPGLYKVSASVMDAYGSATFDLTNKSV
ncbi:hypothetical protein QFZ42_001792 [Variovorax paradoxus]|uniref:hypothetical protein n=1 Tax=Variovorax paradoxus TaxID=34073 RepID=UPI002794CCB3|nr:hypothetical protein [Variovorax paradoxus]MDQ0569958.1 hypothetical protein [Variovorax paradoxus]